MYGPLNVSYFQMFRAVCINIEKKKLSEEKKNFEIRSNTENWHYDWLILANMKHTCKKKTNLRPLNESNNLVFTQTYIKYTNIVNIQSSLFFVESTTERTIEHWQLTRSHNCVTYVSVITVLFELNCLIHLEKEHRICMCVFSTQIPITFTPNETSYGPLTHVYVSVCTCITDSSTEIWKSLAILSDAY